MKKGYVKAGSPEHIAIALKEFAPLGVARSIRAAAYYFKKATQREFVAAGNLLGMSANTIRIQFNKARAA